MDFTIILIIIIMIIIIYLCISKCDHNENMNVISEIASIYNNDLLQEDNLVINNAYVSPSGKFNLLPRGIIVAWTGTTAPPGWVLCDNKTEGVPDLRNKFILSAGPKYSFNKTNTNTETFTLKTEHLPSHNHGFEYIQYNNGVYERGSGSGGTNYVSRDMPIIEGTTGSTGSISPSSFSIMPPYYVLAYIMKT